MFWGSAWVSRLRQATAGDFSTATDLADYLVRTGMPFREAHEVVGRIVRHCELDQHAVRLPFDV